MANYEKALDAYLLAKHICELNEQSGFQQEIMSIEECCELTIELNKLAKSLCKNLREKGNREEIVEEMADVFASNLVLMIRMGISPDEVFDRMTAKYRRGIARYEDHGEL